VIHLAWIRWWSALAYYALSMASGLREIGCRGWIVAPPESPLASRAESSGLAPPDPDRWRDLASTNPARLLHAILDLRGAVRGGEIAGVVVHTGRGHAPAALALRGGAVPLLRVRSEIRRPAGGPLQRWLYGRGTDRCLLSGDFMRRGYLDGLAIPRERVLTLPAGIDFTQVDRIAREPAAVLLRRARGWPERATVIGMLARYSPVKGHRTLIDAARILLERGRDVYFFMAGPEGETGREGVARMVRDIGRDDRFAVLGMVEDPLDTAAGFDIALILSDGSEAVCRSALEYMAVGLPIVATRVNVIPETVGDAAVLIPPGDPVALAEAIDRLIASPDRARSLGRAAADRARREFDSKKIATRALSILQDAQISRRGSS
jgi:glycosyltransferase involved in cell wall biosynthesis